VNAQNSLSGNYTANTQTGVQTGTWQVSATSAPSPTPTSTSSACPAGTTLSSAAWTEQFPDKALLTDLHEPFRTGATQFIAALTNAHAHFKVTSTLRPVQRAWLMRYAYDIVTPNPKWHIDPRNVPSSANIPICWVHTKADGTYNQKASVAAALAMVNAYGISPFRKVKPLLTEPSLTSNHISGWAMDMTVFWSGILTLKDASGKIIKISSGPRTEMNTLLWQVADSYAVYHNGTNKSKVPPAKDAVHWSIDGQ
jgi:hypothetical protein